METQLININQIDQNKGQIAGLPANPRQWTRDDVERLARSIEETPELLDARPLITIPHGGKYIVLGGNLRLAALKKLGRKEAPVYVLPEDTPPDKLREIVVKDNGAFGSWDFDMLANEWDDLPLLDWGVPSWDAEDAVEAGSSSHNSEVKEDDFDDEKDEVETRCKQGDIWELGDHRLMCGDSTNKDDVATLMDGNVARLTLTDPPYRMETVGGGVLKEANSMQQIKENKVNEFEPSLLSIYSDTNIYFHNKSLIKDYILLAEREGCAYDLCVYKKPGLPNYGGHLMTDIEYIAIIGKQAPRKGLDFSLYSKVYEGKKDSDNKLSYSKPIEICGKFIQLYTEAGENILDLFGGSGSTLIAAEQLGRKCYMMELDPHYCDVIIARWEKLTGREAIKLN